MPAGPNASTVSTPASSAPASGGTPTRQRIRSVGSFLLIVASLVAAWEGYKWMGRATGGTWPFTSIELTVRADNVTMPHVWDIIIELFGPARRGGEMLFLLLVKAALLTLREAVVGFLIGASVGFGLGVLFVRSTLAERAFMPYVVASQTVPILAIAPIVVVWGSRLAIPQWLSVSLIAAYLTFFPVTINTLRGLRSPQATAMELMRSYAASPREVLWKLQVPAALPYIFTALKVSASASVIGAIIGELPAGFRDGIGRALLEFSQQFAVRSAKLYATVLIAALAGIVFVGTITLIEHLVVEAGRRQGPLTEPAQAITARIGDAVA